MTFLLDYRESLLLSEEERKEVFEAAVENLQNQSLEDNQIQSKRHGESELLAPLKTLA